MKVKILFAFFLLSITSYAQTWSDDVAQIVYNKCSQCHHVGGVGPFPLLKIPAHLWGNFVAESHRKCKGYA